MGDAAGDAFDRDVTQHPFAGGECGVADGVIQTVAARAAPHGVADAGGDEIGDDGEHDPVNDQIFLWPDPE